VLHVGIVDRERQKKAHGGNRKSSGQFDHLKTAEKIAFLAGGGGQNLHGPAAVDRAVSLLHATANFTKGG